MKTEAHTTLFNEAMPAALADRGSSGSRRSLHDDPTSTSRLAPLSPSTSLSSLPRKPSSSAPLPLSSSLSNAKSPLDRQGRQDWLNEQLAARAQQRDKKAREDQDARKAERDRRWTPLLRRAEFTQEFNLAWQERQQALLDPEPHGVLEFPWARVISLGDLLALRLAGLSLRTLPDSLPDALPQLKTLSVVACELETLPERLGELHMLVELDVTGNRLSALPPSISNLARLESLILCNNKLETLPDDIGGGDNGSPGLQRLERLLVEQNALQTLPQSIGTLSSVVLINLNGNRLDKLPESTGDMPRLETLSVSLNVLVELPEALARLPKLRILHANRNSLRGLPHNFGDFDALEDLQLDWNALRELPFSFRKLRATLRTLSMEQNPLVLPPSEIVVRGVVPTMAYMDKALEEFQCRARRTVLEALQQLLQLIAPLAVSMDTSEPQQSVEDQAQQLSDGDKEDLSTIRSLFEPQCKHAAPAHGGEQLPFFAVVWDEFYDTLLPAIERQLQRLALVADAKSSEDDLKTTTKVDASELSKAARFSSRFTPEEVEDALANSADDFGAASLQATSALFRKCACLEPLTPQTTARDGDTPNVRPSTPQQRQARRRRVCPPPGVAPYRCRRAARFIREQMMTHDEAKDQLATTYLRVKLARLEAATKRQCIKYINSEEGVVHFEQLTAQLAAALFGKRKRLRALEAKYKKAVEKIAARRAKLLAKLEAYARARASRRETLEAKIAKLSAKAAAGNKASEKRVKRLEEELADELALGGGASGGGGDDPRVLELELALEGLAGAEAKLNDAHTAAKTRELSSFLDETKGAQSGGDDVDDDEDEDDGDENEDDGDSDDEDDSDEGDDDDEDGEEETASAPSEAEPDPTAENSRFFQFDLPDESLLVDYRVAAMQQVEHELHQRQQELDQQHEAKYAAKKGKPKPPPNLVVHLEELIELFQPRVRGSYVTERCARVAHRATIEYLQMRAVLRRWLSHGKRAVFEAWRDYMRANRADAEKRRAKGERRKLLEEQNRALAEQLARKEARKWVQRVDMYSDAVYFEHSESGETSWTPPQYWEEEQYLQQQEASQQPEQPAAKVSVRLPRI